MCLESLRLEYLISVMKKESYVYYNCEPLFCIPLIFGKNTTFFQIELQRVFLVQKSDILQVLGLEKGLLLFWSPWVRPITGGNKEISSAKDIMY